METEVIFELTFCPGCKEFVEEVEIHAGNRKAWVCEQCGQVLSAAKKQTKTRGGAHEHD